MKTCLCCLLLIILVGCGDSRDSFEAEVVKNPTFMKMDSGGYGFYASAAMVYSRRANEIGLPVFDEFIGQRENGPYAQCLLHMLLVGNSQKLLDWLENGNQLTAEELDLVQAWVGIPDDKAIRQQYKTAISELIK